MRRTPRVILLPIAPFEKEVLLTVIWPMKALAEGAYYSFWRARQMPAGEGTPYKFEGFVDFGGGGYGTLDARR